jgi:hypothetical protein
MAKTISISAIALALVIFFSGAILQAAVTKGSVIEVREGDDWSKVTVMAVEGERAQVKYDDGTLEWVGPDRMRPVGTAVNPPTTPAPTDQPAAATDPKTTPKYFTVNEQVEFKFFNDWHTGKIVQISNGWGLVVDSKVEMYGNQPRTKQYWMEPWSMRVVGSDYDVDGFGGGQEAQPGQVAPDRPQGQPPHSTGNQYVVLPADQRTVSKDELQTKFDLASWDNAREPAGGANVTVHIATTQPSSEFSAWALHNTEGDLLSIIPSPDGKTAIAMFRGGFGRAGQVVRTSLVDHTQVETRPVPVNDLQILSAGQDGDELLTAFDFEKVVQLWKWTDHKYKLVENLKVDEKEPTVTAGALVGPGLAVIQQNDHMVCLVDLNKKQILSNVHCADNAKMFVHPSQQIVGLLTSSGTALLLRASDFAVIGEYDEAGSESNVSVDASGQYAAYPLTSGVVRVVKVADGTQIGQVAVGSSFKGRIDLVDDEFLLIDNATVYDIKSGIPVWIYKCPDGVKMAPANNGQFVFGFGAGFRATHGAMALASIPDHVGRSAMKSASKDEFILKPGTAIKIDADYSAFGDDKQKASDTVNDIVTRAGMTISTDDQPFHLTMTVAAGPTETRDYSSNRFPGPFASIGPAGMINVPSSILTATLMYKGDAVWSQEIRFSAGGILQSDANHTTFQDVANAAAKPNVWALKTLSFPSFLPKGAKPGTPAALGQSDLADRRFVPERPGTNAEKTATVAPGSHLIRR